MLGPQFLVYLEVLVRHVELRHAPRHPSRVARALPRPSPRNRMIHYILQVYFFIEHKVSWTATCNLENDTRCAYNKIFTEASLPKTTLSYSRIPL